eukprot:TRINITY_DN3643_c0_g1_i1.p1 TRINITY_DN3643_c0_g1~~TRINITY_DN3643_c0_g1_i1.p1  ORF type:complete len:550 (+),score=98.75 TRINITY_DN3643_c0_g1_i1:913-2562(+)
MESWTTKTTKRKRILSSKKHSKMQKQAPSYFFSFAKPPVDGTAALVSLGVETIDRTSNHSKKISKGTTMGITWKINLSPGGESFSNFQLNLSTNIQKSYPSSSSTRFSRRKTYTPSLSTTLSDTVKHFVSAYDIWLGWIFGNNPASVICLHEMAWFPMIQSIYATSPATTSALEKEIIFLLENGVMENGLPWQRWYSDGFYDAPWGPLHDQVPHSILAVYFMAMKTGNVAFVERLMPQIDRVAEYLISLEYKNNITGQLMGVIAVKNSSGLSDGLRHATTWYDIIEFGNVNSYISIYATLAFDAMAKMKAFIGDPVGAATWKNVYKRFVKGFNEVFWSDDLKFYIDWIDIQGKQHNYLYTDQALLAIVFGIANETQSKIILETLDDAYADLEKLCSCRIGVTPANMWNISVLGDVVGNSTLGFPGYENGCSFFHTTGLEIAARAKVSSAEDAFVLFVSSMEVYQENSFWGASYDWKAKTLSSEPLSDSLLVMWGFMRGVLGINMDLDGLSFSRPAQDLEGTTFSFEHLGEDITVAVKNGTIVVLNTGGT